MKRMALTSLMMWLMASTLVLADGKKIVKWVDKNGVTQYGDRLPASEAGRNNAEINQQGVLIKKNDSELKKSAEQDVLTAEQNRRDNALLGSYNSIEEIEIASKRNTQIDEFALQGIQQKIASLKEAQKKNAAELAKDNKKRPNLTQSLLADKQRIATEIKINENKALLKTKDIAAIRARYEQNKIRYAELKPRDQSIAEIKEKKRSLAELEAWQRQASAKLAGYQAEATQYNRSFGEVSPRLKEQIQLSIAEVSRADKAVLDALIELRAKERNLSQGQASTTSKISKSR